MAEVRDNGFEHTIEKNVEVLVRNKAEAESEGVEPINSNTSETVGTTTEDFESIVLQLLDLTMRLKNYDYFASMAILTNIQLMMSKSDQYLKELHKLPNLNNITTPEELADEVDSIISKVKSKLEDC